MASINPSSNARTESTTWTPKVDRMRRSRPEGQREQPPEASFKGLSKLPRTEPVTLTLRYRGGSVAWILVQARGRRQVFPGVTDLYTVLSAVQGHWDRNE